LALAFDAGNAGNKGQNSKFASIFFQLSVEQLPDHDDAWCLAVSDFNAKRGFTARSEAARICCNSMELHEPVNV